MKRWRVWLYGEHMGVARLRLDEAAVRDVEVPVGTVLRLPLPGRLREPAVVRHPVRPALDHHVETRVEGVGPRRQDHLGVGRQVAGLAFRRARTEVEGALRPDADERGDVGAAVERDRGEPVQRGAGQCGGRLRPGAGRRPLAAVAGVQLGGRGLLVRGHGSSGVVSGGAARSFPQRVDSAPAPNSSAQD